MNRCVECNLFKPWDELELESYTPDNEFGPEVIDYICHKCVGKFVKVSTL
jgi:hypothetical protein